MPINGSRYQHTRAFSGDGSQPSVFKGNRARVIGTATGVLEYVVREGDRLDLLALHFYVDSRKWWRILDANPGIIFGQDLTIDEFIGETILIPRAREPGAGR